MTPKTVLFATAVFSFLFAVGCQGAALAAVGYQSSSIAVAGGAPIPVAIWYPSSAAASDLPLGLFRQTVAQDGALTGRSLPLIVISHGTGGSKDGHYDTALALANAGFVVAALEHTGDNYRDQSRATDLANRPRELHLLIDYMLAVWPGHAALNADRVGAFGFSAGGFTVLTAAGGTPELLLLAPHCRDHPLFFDCLLVAARPGSADAFPTFVSDTRIKALVVAAPALGFTFAKGLSEVTQPVQLWRADDDQVLPAPFYADVVHRALPVPPEFHDEPRADHYDFLAPCSEALAKAVPGICKSRPGFDRAAFHTKFNAAIVSFFARHLGRKQATERKIGGL